MGPGIATARSEKVFQLEITKIFNSIMLVLNASWEWSSSMIPILKSRSTYPKKKPHFLFPRTFNPAASALRKRVKKGVK